MGGGGGGEREKRGCFPGQKHTIIVNYAFVQGVSFWKKTNAVVAQSEDGVAYERVTFPLGHSCSELLFSF